MVLNLSLTLILTPALVGAICGVLGSGLHVQRVVEKRQVERRVQRGEGAMRALGDALLRNPLVCYDKASFREG